MPGLNAPGPPKRLGRRPNRITEDILGLKSAPVLGNLKRAWNILGYGSTPNPPNYHEFISQINNLWEYHYRDTHQTRRWAEARAHILDALKVLGFRNATWNVYLPRLRMTGREGVGYMAYGWFDAPNRGSVGFSDARKYFGSEVSHRSFSMGDWGEAQDKLTWIKYHRYFGFYVTYPTNQTEPPNTEDYRCFRAIHVPQGPNSLWHSLSFWVGQLRQPNPGQPREGRSIWFHWQVKARIWTYFMQVLKDKYHQRWAAYHRLQWGSRIRDPNYGQLSLARSLYASPQQGLPAFPTGPEILCVVADYFWVEIICFYPPGTKSPSWDDLDHRANDFPADHWLDTDTHEYGDLVGAKPWVPGLDLEAVQTRYHYRWRNFGPSARGDDRVRQIFLVTDDWKNFDPVYWEKLGLYETAEFDGLINAAAAEDTFDPPLFATDPSPAIPLSYANIMLPNPIDLLDTGYGGPFRNIRYNLPPVDYDPTAAPWQPDFQTETISGNTAQNQAPRYHDVKLTSDILRRFRGGEDIPGKGFKGINAQGTEFINGSGNGGVNPCMEPSWQWRFGPHPLATAEEVAQGLADGVPDMRFTLECGQEELLDPLVVYSGKRFPC